MNKTAFLLAALISIPGHADTQTSGFNASNTKHTQHYPDHWETVKLKGLNLKRLQVPGGWLVREGLGKLGGLAMDTQERAMIFVPDTDHQWPQMGVDSWNKVVLTGLNLYRLKTPQGWLVREGIGKIGLAEQTREMLYLKDEGHQWSIN